jgi:hypothetical protein
LKEDLTFYPWREGSGEADSFCGPTRARAGLAEPVARDGRGHRCNDTAMRRETGTPLDRRGEPLRIIRASFGTRAGDGCPRPHTRRAGEPHGLSSVRPHSRQSTREPTSTAEKALGSRSRVGALVCFGLKWVRVPVPLASGAPNEWCALRIPPARRGSSWLLNAHFLI